MRVTTTVLLLILLALLMIVLTGCQIGDSPTAPPLPVCGQNGCELGETVLNCPIDCAGTVPPPPMGVSYSLAVNPSAHSPFVLIATVSPGSAVGRVTWRQRRGGNIEQEVVTSRSTHEWDLRAVQPDPCDVYVFEAEVDPAAGYEVDEQPDAVTVSIPASECAGLVALSEWGA